MALIQPHMAVKCRTPEEVAIYEEIARAEGHSTPYGEIQKSGAVKRLYITNYSDTYTYPKDVGHTSTLNYLDNDPKFTVIEASDLFRNQLISRRIKHERSSTE